MRDSELMAVADGGLREVAAAVPMGSRWSRYQVGSRALDSLDRAAIPDSVVARVALVGSFTLEPFIPFLRVEGARSGLWIEPYLAPYGQYLQELLDPHSGLYQFQPHATFVAIDADVLWNQRWSGSAPPASEAVVGQLLKPLFAGLECIEQRGSGIVVVNDFILPRRSTEGVNAFRSKGTFVHTVAHANKQLRMRLAQRNHTYLFPLADAVAQHGRTRAFNWRTHYRGHVTWSDEFMAVVASRYTGFALAARGKATKCILLDLDNTLWGGVVGEDGPHGITLGPDTPGREFQDFQRELLNLQRQGILLAVCSKNNEAEAIAVLRDHPHMIIREHHLAAHRINWQDKATNVRSLARELNLGLDHMLLIDDSPHERQWVRGQLPGLVVPDMPEDASLYADWIGALPSLVVLQQTVEDLLRTDQYRQGRVREEFRQAVGSVEDFLRGLDLRVEIDSLTDGTVTRVAQLLAKTNQFNLTTRRHDETALRREVERGRWLVYTMRVVDRFGDFGLVGVAIAVLGSRTWHLDSFLLSCRVIGKSVESALLAAVASSARAAGAERLAAEYLDSGRNQVAAHFLTRHGFVQLADGTFERSLSDGGPSWPEWIADVSTQPAAGSDPTASATDAESRSEPS